VENPKAEDVECLCKLLATIGGQLDQGKGQERMDAYFLRLNRLKDVPALEARHRFMIQARTVMRA
jgi:translation initiation factor 4G